MKLTIDRNNLIAAATTCLAVAKGKSDKPVASCILFASEGIRLHAKATDLYQEIATSVMLADCQEPGSFMIKARDIIDRAKSFPSGLLTLSLGSEKLEMVAGKRRHTIQTLADEEYPVTTVEPPNGFDIASAKLAAVIAKTRHGMSKSADRAFLHGLCFERSSGRLTVVASDGVRMPAVELNDPAVVEGPSMIVPYSSVEAVADMLGNAGDTIRFAADSRRAWFTGENVSLWTALVDAKFVPWRSFMASVPDNVLTLDRGAFSDALSSVAKGAEETGFVGMVELRVTPGVMSITAVSSAKSAAQDEIDAEYSGPEMWLGVYANQITEALDVIDTDRVRVSMKDVSNPLMIRPAEGDGERYLVMPARLPVKADDLKEPKKGKAK